MTVGFVFDLYLMLKRDATASWTESTNRKKKSVIFHLFIYFVCFYVYVGQQPAI